MKFASRNAFEFIRLNQGYCLQLVEDSHGCMAKLGSWSDGLFRRQRRGGELEAWEGFLGSCQPNEGLGGGNSNIFDVHPENWGHDPIWRAYFLRWVGSTTNYGKWTNWTMQKLRLHWYFSSIGILKMGSLNGLFISLIMIWVFPKIGIPQNGWFIMENPIKMGWFGGTPIFGNTHISYHDLIWFIGILI